MSTALSRLPAPLVPKSGFGYSTETDPAIYKAFSYLPKITVITPNFNYGRFLEQTIRSVLAQNYPNLEFLIMDGSSSDNSVDIIKMYEPYGISGWISEKDNGTFDANNKGLARMTGDYWCVLNSDDTLLDKGLFYVVERLNKPGEKPEWITGGVVLTNQDYVVVDKLMPEPPEPLAGYTFAQSCWIYHPSTFLSKKVYEVIGRFRANDVMDYDYWVRMERVRYFPEVIPHFIATLHFHPDCKSYNYIRILKTMKEVVEGLYNEQQHELSFDQIAAYKKRIKEWDLLYLQTLIKASIFEKKIGSAFKQLLYTSLTYPEQVFTRWFWGANKRLITGVKEHEFNMMMFLKESKVKEDAAPEQDSAA
ncbi:MAG: glycosyltransferase family 2 protein [Bacteroidota bacterium]